MSGLARIYNPFAYPGTKPGFDPTHYASQGIRYSGVASPTGLIPLGSPIAGANSFTANGQAIDGIIGPSQAYVGTEALVAINGVFPNVTDLSQTFGVIFRLSSLSAADATLFYTSSVNSFSQGCTFSIYTTGNLEVIPVGNNIVSSLVATPGVPYFAAASTQTGKQNFVLANLQTGQVKTATTTNTYTMNASGSQYMVGMWRPNGGNSTLKGNLAAVSYSATFLSMSQLLQWAASPWAFWYPPDPTTLGLGVIGLYSGAPPVVTLDVLGNPIYRVRREGWGW